jgi:hypothetical protein
MFGELLSKIVAAPLRIAAIPGHLLDVAVGDAPADNVFDEMADETEEQIRKIIE